MKKKVTNEMKVLREFVKEFSPFHNGLDHEEKEITDTMNYDELFDVVEDIVNAHYEEIQWENIKEKKSINTKN